jgi:2-aminoadipate transaminase
MRLREVKTMESHYSDVQAADAPAGALPFIYGHVDPTLFPIRQIEAAAAQALREYGPLALNYGEERGCGLLLAYLSKKLTRDEGTPIETDNLMLSAGASAALDTVCRCYTRPGDVVLVEAPSYHEALMVIRDYPVQLAGIPMDEQGLIVDALAERLRQLAAAGARPALLYTIPSFQNPSGATLSATRRPAVLELARRYGFKIVEDDVYRDLAFEPGLPPSLYSLDAQQHGENVIRLGSFSKILAPGLRLGWMTAAPAHITRVAASGLMNASGGANPFVAYVTAMFCRDGALEQHVERLVNTYRQRRDVMLAALEATMPEEVRWTRPKGGFFVWLTLPEPLTAAGVLAEALRHDITFLTGEPFYAEGGGERHIRLPYSFIPPETMEEGIHTLAGIVRRQLQVGQR